MTIVAPASAKDPMSFGIDYHVEGRIEEAIQIYTTLLNQNPSHFDALFLLGVALLQAEQEEAGEECIRRATPQLAGIEHCGLKDGIFRQRGRFTRYYSLLASYLEYKKLQNIDAFIISYPKCGRTWLRLLLGKFLQQHFGLAKKTQLLETHDLTSTLSGVPRLDFSHDDFPQWKPASDIEQTKQRYRGKKVVFLVRDPRDVLVSYYFQYARRGDKALANDADFNGSLSDFLRHRIGGIDNVLAFYNVWAKEREIPAAFFLLRYEDLHASPLPILKRLLKFLQFPASKESLLKQVIEFCEFDNMRRMESENTLRTSRLAAPVLRDPESFKVRRGKIGGYKDYLGREDIDFLDHKLADLNDLYESYK